MNKLRKVFLVINILILLFIFLNIVNAFESVTDTLSEGETKNYILDGKNYDVTPTEITDTGTIYAKFNINGELTIPLKKGDSTTLPDGATLTVIDIMPNEAGDVTQDLVQFTLSTLKEIYILNFSDYPNDVDGDGFYDYLTIEIKVNVTKADEYEFYGSLWSSTNNPLGDDGDSSYLNVGEHILSLSFPTSRIYQSGINGPYTLKQLSIHNGYNFEFFNIYNTSFYDYRDFEIPIGLTSTFSDYGIDSDGNGLFDYLIIEVEVNVTQEGNYKVEGLVEVMGEDMDSQEDTYYLNKGVQNIKLNFSGLAFYLSGIDGPYTLWGIEISKTPHHMSFNVNYNTSSYNYTDFEKPGAKLIRNFSDCVLDTNGNGLYDYLVIESGINVTKAGNYEIWGRLKDSLNNRIRSKDFESYLDTGIYNIPLNFTGMAIYKNRVDGPYQLQRLYLYDRVNMVTLERLDDVYNTSSYNYTDFERPGLEVIGNLTDYSTDIDGDGLYDYLTVRVPINVTVAGYYQIEAEMDDINAEIDTAVYLNLNEQFIYLNFPGFYFYNSGKNGRYILEEFSIEYDDFEVYEMLDEYHTNPYNYTDFEHEITTVNCTIPTDGMIITKNTTFCPGTYNLPNGIEIRADNIVLDCDGANLNGAGSDFGINITNINNIVVKNCTITNYDEGINLYYSNNNSITSNRIYSNYMEGIILFHSNGNVLTFNNAPNNDIGIYLRFSSNNNIISNRLYLNNLDGISLSSSNNNILLNNSMYSNDDSEISVYDSNSNNIRYNNIYSSDDVGIRVSASPNNTIEYNNIYNNSNYNFYNNQIDNTIVENNYWGTTDITEIQNKIYDYYDDNSLGIVDFCPFLNAPYPFGNSTFCIEDTSPPTITIISPIDGSTVTTNSTWLNVMTDEDATCKCSICKFSSWSGSPSGGGGCSVAKNMSITGGTSHSQFITGLENTINDETRTERYSIAINCTDNFTNSNTKSVSFNVNITHLISKISLSPFAAIYDPNPGDEFSTQFIVMNVGTANLTKLLVNFSGLPDFNLSANPALFDLNVGEEKRVSVYGRVPYDINTSLSPFIAIVTISNEEVSVSSNFEINVNLPKADLTVTDIIFNPESPTTKDTLQISATIKNIGKVATAFWAEFEAVEPNANLSDPKKEQTHIIGIIKADPTNLIEPSEAVNISFEAFGPIIEGTYIITVTVHSEEPDSNLSNNQRTETIYVSKEECIPNWVLDNNPCLTNDTKLISYTDINNCNTTKNLPVDNGTYVECNYCVPNWILNNTWSDCINNQQFKNYYDANNCNESETKEEIYQSCGLNVTNNPPIANAGNDQIVTINTTVTLNGASSYDPDGTITSYTWTQVSGTNVIVNNANNPIATFIPTQSGIYIFKLTVTDNNSLSDDDSVTINVEELPPSPPPVVVTDNLTISDLDVKVGDKTSKDLSNGDTISRKAKLGDKVKFDVEVKNIFSSSSDIQIDNIEVTVAIKDIDNDDDLEESADIQDLDAGDDDSATIEFAIPTLVDEGTYDVIIEVDGEDDNGKDQGETWGLKLEVKKDKHDLLIQKADLSSLTVECNRNPSLDVKVINIGSEDEDKVTIKISNDKLGLNIEENNIEIEEGSDEDSVFEKTYNLKIDDDVEAGTYPITIRAYYDNKASDQKTVDLMIKECAEKEEITSLEAEPVEVIKTTKPVTTPVEPSVTEISFTETPGFIAILLFIFIILLGLVISALFYVTILFRK